MVLAQVPKGTQPSEEFDLTGPYGVLSAYKGMFEKAFACPTITQHNIGSPSHTLGRDKRGEQCILFVASPTLESKTVSDHLLHSYIFAAPPTLPRRDDLRQCRTTRTISTTAMMVP